MREIADVTVGLTGDATAGLATAHPVYTVDDADLSVYFACPAAEYQHERAAERTGSPGAEPARAAAEYLRRRRAAKPLGRVDGGLSLYHRVDHYPAAGAADPCPGG